MTTALAPDGFLHLAAGHDGFPPATRAVDGAAPLLQCRAGCIEVVRGSPAQRRLADTRRPTRRAFPLFRHSPGRMDGSSADRPRFQDVDEIYIFRVSGGKPESAFGVEDNVARMRQLGLNT